MSVGSPRVASCRAMDRAQRSVLRIWLPRKALKTEMIGFRDISVGNLTEVRGIFNYRGIDKFQFESLA
jgi:hypothetical protein